MIPCALALAGAPCQRAAQETDQSAGRFTPGGGSRPRSLQPDLHRLPRPGWPGRRPRAVAGCEPPLLPRERGRHLRCHQEWHSRHRHAFFRTRRQRRVENRGVHPQCSRHGVRPGCARQRPERNDSLHRRRRLLRMPHDPRPRRRSGPGPLQHRRPVEPEETPGSPHERTARFPMATAPPP